MYLLFNFKILCIFLFRAQLFLTYHSYGQFILHTWGYRQGTPPNVAELTEMGNIAAQAIQNVNGNRYRVGGAADLLYAASG